MGACKSQRMAASVAFQQSGKDVIKTGFGFPFSVAERRVCVLPKLFGNQRWESVFDNDPLVLALCDLFLALERLFSAFPTDEVSEVDFIPHQSVDRHKIPV